MGWVSYAEDILARSQDRLDNSNLLLRHSRPDLRNEFEAASRARDVAQDVLNQLRSLLELATDPSVDAAAELAQLRKKVAQLESADLRATKAEHSVIAAQMAHDQVRKELEERDVELERCRRQLLSEQAALGETREAFRELSVRNEKLEVEHQAARAMNLKERIYQRRIQEMKTENENLLRTKSDGPRTTVDHENERIRNQTCEQRHSGTDQTMRQLADEQGIRKYDVRRRKG